jgi:alpha-L-rhamnosidase
MTLTPYALRCEYRETPLGLGERRPRLSWKLAAEQRGQAQSAYRVQVATRRTDLDRGEPAWDSGWVPARDEQEAEYGGAPLQSSTRYWWRVQVRDVHGNDAGTAESWFETGLLHADDWVAVWIGHDPMFEELRDPPRNTDHTFRTRRLPHAPHLRRSFTLQAAPVRARVHVTAHGLYELRLNGAKVGDGELLPGWTDYRIRVQYQTYDVTDALAAGENVLGAIIADGWWSGYYGQNPRRAGEHYGTAPELLAQLIVDFADGSQRVIATDDHWRENRGPLVYADMLIGERYYAAGELGRWDEPGYDDSAWKPVLIAGRDRSTLVATVDEPVRVTRELSPVSVDHRGSGRHIVDLGQNMVGRVRLAVRGASAGQRIVLRHAEILDSDGELYTANLRTADATDVYFAAGRDVEVFEPRFTFHGFRFVEVSGYPGELGERDVTGVVLASDTPRAGEFSCSDPVVCQLQSNIQWGQRGNFVSVPTDCPQRDERLGWTADAQIFLPTACYNADVAAFFTKWMQDVRDAQGGRGDFPNVAPRLVVDRIGAPAWGDAGVTMPWHLYRTYGDRRLLARSLDSMIAWVEWIRSNNPDLVWRKAVGAHYGDWLQVNAETSRDVLATAYFAHDTDLVSRAARELGRPEAAEYAELFERIRAVFNERFVSPDARVTGDTQTGYLLALAFDLLPEDKIPRAVEHLVADIEAHGRHLTTGFVGVVLLCPVLTAHGHTDLAYALLHQDTYPSWAYSILHGATTIWERWDGWTEEHGFQAAAMNSFNHYSLGSVGEWMFRDVAGIGQAAASLGFRDLVLRPRVGGRLSWVEASYDSVRGPVRSRWERAGDQLRLQVEIPPGATATVHVPTVAPDGVTEGGAPIADSAGIEIVGSGPDTLRCVVGSGQYTFTSTYHRFDGQ